MQGIAATVARLKVMNSSIVIVSTSILRELTWAKTPSMYCSTSVVIVSAASLELNVS